MARVRVEQGALLGDVNAHSSGTYLSFKGIPYAQPPIGKLRFKAPEPAQPWQGERDARQHGAVCPQYNERMDRMELDSENCLLLNVYTPSITPLHALPVMVWIHGGGFYTGSGNSDFYGPEYLVQENVILVTFNYRLEVLGFLCLDIDEVPGNAGLKDQVAALKWVKKNIAAFGGDSNNITIFGCSAGAASTSLHLISKMSTDLYNKAICQSGKCLNEWAYNLHGPQVAFQLGKSLGFETDDPVALLDFLREVPISSLVNIKLPPLDVEHFDLADTLLFGPVIEKSHLKGEKFLTELPIEIVKRGEMADVPIILGYTSGDGIEVGRRLQQILKFVMSVGAVVPRELKLKWNTEDVERADEKIRQFYFGGQISSEMLQEYSDLETFRMFAYNIQRYARHHVRYNTQPAYLYKFSAETERNYVKHHYNMSNVKGVCHSDDLPYLFNITNIKVPLTNESEDIIREFVRLWTNFARNGSPTADENTEQWKPFTEKSRYCYIISKTFTCVQNVDAENNDLWETIYGEEDLY